MDWLEEIPLTRLQCELIRFMRDEGRPVDVHAIGQGLDWYDGYYSENAIYKLISKTRRRLREYGAPARIENAGYGRGWRLVQIG